MGCFGHLALAHLKLNKNNKNNKAELLQYLVFEKENLSIKLLTDQVVRNDNSLALEMRDPVRTMVGRTSCVWREVGGVFSLQRASPSSVMCRGLWDTGGGLWDTGEGDGRGLSRFCNIGYKLFYKSKE